MRTHLVTLAATLTVIGFATTAAAATASSVSSGGSGGGFSAPSGGSSGGSSSSSGGSSGGGSHGGGGGGGGGSHSGGGGGAGYAGGAANRGGGFQGRSGFNGYGGFGAQTRDIAHGGYRMVGIRPANVSAGVRMTATTTTSTHSVHNSLELGPRQGSAAKATLLSDDKHHRGPGGPGHHPHHPRYQAGLAEYVRYENCLPADSCVYGLPQELCPEFPGYDNPVFADCWAPRKLKWPANR